jgi:hypothetical protein
MTSRSDAENLLATISAEDARAKLGEKRKVYARCLGALLAYTHAAGTLAQGAELPPAEYAELEEDSDRTRMAAMNATSEVYLIGHPEVVRLANRTLGLALSAETGGQVEDPVEAVAELTGAMRRDLGERVRDVRVSHRADPESGRASDIPPGTRSLRRLPGPGIWRDPLVSRERDFLTAGRFSRTLRLWL